MQSFCPSLAQVHVASNKCALILFPERKWTKRKKRTYLLLGHGKLAKSVRNQFRVFSFPEKKLVSSADQQMSRLIWEIVWPQMFLCFRTGQHFCPPNAHFACRSAAFRSWMPKGSIFLRNYAEMVYEQKRCFLVVNCLRRFTWQDSVPVHQRNWKPHYKGVDALQTHPTNLHDTTRFCLKHKDFPCNVSYTEKSVFVQFSRLKIWLNNCVYGGKIRKMPNHKRNMAKRRCIPQMPSSKMPSG